MADFSSGSTRRIKAALCGFAVSLAGLFSLPALADTAAGQGNAPELPAAPNRIDVNLSKSGRSLAALGMLKRSGRIDQWAQGYGMTRQQAENLFINDNRAYVDKRGGLMFIEHLDGTVQNVGGVSGAGLSSAALSIPTDQVFLQHSRPGSQRKLYLDFNGHVTQGTAWNDSYRRATISSPPFDLDGVPGSFNTAELAVIYGIWQRVREDYAPFDIDVTTEEPPADQMTRSSSQDGTFGIRVVITRDFTPGTSEGACQCGGFAYVGVFGSVSEYNKPAFVFYDNLSSVEKFIAEAVTHEAGHTMGLNHDGQGTLGYFEGQGTGATGWAPIMGVGYSRQLTQWSKGEYFGANNKQDDYLVMQNNGVRFAPDEHGNTAANATSLNPQVLNGLNVFKSSGVIQGPLDVDFFRITASAGAVTVNLSPDLKDPNLDALVTLRNAAGTQLAVANPVDALNAVLQFNLPAAGTYFVSVQGTGKGSPLTTGYSSYGSIGSYSLEITAPIAPATPLPVASISASPASGRAPLAVTFSGALSSGSGTLRYSWDFGDGTSSSLAVPSRKTYNLPGNYTVVLRVTDGGGMSATASTTIQATAAPTARTMGVQSIAITGVLVSPNRPDAYARAIVTVRDNLGAPVPNAKVFGRWSGIVSSNLVAVTNTSGQASLSSPSTPFVGTFSFAVTNITATGYVYNIQSNQISGRSINF